MTHALIRSQGGCSLLCLVMLEVWDERWEGYQVSELGEERQEGTVPIVCHQMPDVALTPHPALPVCLSSDFLRVYRWLQWCLGVRAGTGGVLSASWCSVLPDWGHWLDQGWWPGNTVSYSQLASLSLSTTYSRVTTSYQPPPPTSHLPTPTT